LDCLSLNTKRRLGRNVGNYTSKRHNVFSQETRVFSNANFRNLNFEKSTYLPFFSFFLLSIISLCSTAPFEHPPPPRPSFTRSNPRSVTRRIQIIQSVIKSSLFFTHFTYLRQNERTQSTKGGTSAVTREPAFPSVRHKRHINTE